MMSKTHIAVGVAASLAVMRPDSVTGCCIAVMGAAIGSVISDIDTRSNARCRDALYGRIIALAVMVGSLVVDLLNGGAACRQLVDSLGVVTVAGIIGFAAFCIFGVLSDHRTFTHSILGLGLSTLAIALVFPPLAAPYAIGFASHLVLDLLNKKPERLLFPLKKGSVCLGLCYADGLANTVLMVVGSLASFALLAWFAASVI